MTIYIFQRIRLLGIFRHFSLHFFRKLFKNLSYKLLKWNNFWNNFQLKRPHSFIWIKTFHFNIFYSGKLSVLTAIIWSMSCPVRWSMVYFTFIISISFCSDFTCNVIYSIFLATLFWLTKLIHLEKGRSTLRRDTHPADNKAKHFNYEKCSKRERAK